MNLGDVLLSIANSGFCSSLIFNCPVIITLFQNAQPLEMGHKNGEVTASIDHIQVTYETHWYGLLRFATGQEANSGLELQCSGGVHEICILS